MPSTPFGIHASSLLDLGIETELKHLDDDTAVWLAERWLEE